MDRYIRTEAGVIYLMDTPLEGSIAAERFDAKLASGAWAVVAKPDVTQIEVDGATVYVLKTDPRAKKPAKADAEA